MRKIIPTTAILTVLAASITGCAQTGLNYASQSSDTATTTADEQAFNYDSTITEMLAPRY